MAITQSQIIAKLTRITGTIDSWHSWLFFSS